MLARRETSKFWTSERASKSSHFRPDNQRQISLVLNHTCRNRKRLISLINSATFFEIMRLARCEYSKYFCEIVSIVVFEVFPSDLVSECQRNRSWCQPNRTSVSISELYNFSFELFSSIISSHSFENSFSNF